MAWLPISQTAPQYVDGNGDPYSGAVLKFYEDGTTTNTNMATDNTGGTQLASVALDSNGYPSNGGAVFIPHLDQTYKIALYPTQAAADSDTGAIWTVDDISPADLTDTDTDELAKVSSNDTTAGYLNGKLVASDGIDFTETNDGANETLEISIGDQSGIILTEGADHSQTPTAGKGEIWVENQTPNVLRFTDDAGEDFYIMGPVVMASQNTTSGTFIDFTGIPPWATQVVIGLNQTQTNGSSEVLIQIGDAGGIENSGYISSSSLLSTGVNTSSNTAGFGIRTQAANEEFSGSIILTLIDSANNTWVANGNFSRDSTTEGVVSNGRKSLSGVLTQVRITSFSGDTFNGGSAGVRYS